VSGRNVIDAVYQLNITDQSDVIFFPSRYLQEFTALGTAGGMYHFRDQIRSGNPDAFLVLNGDVCADFPLQELLDFHLNKDKPLVGITCT